MHISKGFPEPGQTQDYFSHFVHSRATTIKNQIGMGSELVYINHRSLQTTGRIAQYGIAQGTFAFIERRCRRVQQQANATCLQTVDGRFSVLKTGKAFPGIFTNQNTGPGFAEIKGKDVFRRFKIPRFVKHVIGRQQRLPLYKAFAFVQYKSCIGNPAAFFLRVSRNGAHNHSNSHCRCGHLVQCLFRTTYKVVVIEQIFRRVATNSQFAEENQ